MYEALEELQKFANQKLKTGKLDVKVTFLPMRVDQVEAALNEGVGDIIAYGIVVTPEREQRVAFSTPIMTDVSQIIVTGKNFGAVSSLADLGGKEVYVNPLTTYYTNLQKANETLQKEGKTPIVIKEADKNLMDDDLVQMVNAGLIPATVTTKQKAALWSQVLTGIQPHPDLVIASGAQLAWVMRKNNPQLKQLVDEFVASHAVGTSFGNTLVRRYLQNTKWVKDSTSSEEMKKFQANLALFQKYSGEYDFDYLMIAAQGYQESLLDQSRRNPSGAVGIMQVIPKYAAASPINIPNVSTADGNIHAGVKMLRDIDDTLLQRSQDRRIEQDAVCLRQLQRGAEPHCAAAQRGARHGPRSQRLVQQCGTGRGQRHWAGDGHLRFQYLQVLRRLQAGGRHSGTPSRRRKDCRRIRVPQALKRSGMLRRHY